MADEIEDEKQDRVDELMVQIARGRVAIGAAALLAPGPVARLSGLGRGKDSGRDLMTRMFAAREIALGAGYLLSQGSGRKTWARLGLMVDSLDTVAGLKSRSPKGSEGRLPLWVSAGFTVVAAGAAGIGAAKVAKDVSGR